MSPAFSLGAVDRDIIVGLPEEQYETGLTRFIQVKPSQEDPVALDDVDVDAIEAPSPDSASPAVRVVLQLAGPNPANESVLDGEGHSAATSPTPSDADKCPDPIPAPAQADANPSPEPSEDYNGEDSNLASADASPEPAPSPSPASAPAPVVDAHVHPEEPIVAQGDSGQGASQEDSEEEARDLKAAGSGDPAPLATQHSFAEPDDAQAKTVTRPEASHDDSRTLDFQVMPAGVPMMAWGGPDEAPSAGARVSFD